MKKLKDAPLRLISQKPNPITIPPTIAPVDPEAVARDVLSTFDGKIHGPLGWSNYTTSEREALTTAMRATLAAAGIPVTPEVGK